MPDEYAVFLGRLYELVPGLRDIVLSVHCHNDLGLAVANSFAGLQDLGGELDVGAGGVHRAELDVLDERAGVRDGGTGLAQHVLTRGLQLVLDMDVRRGDERVHARALRVAHRFGRPLDVSRMGTRQACDHRALDLAGDRPYGLEITGGGDRETSLDDIDAEPRELLGDLQLLGGVQLDPGRRVSVSQGGVEDLYAVHRGAPCLGSRLLLRLSSRLAGATHRSP
jgi:hypothetical protein